MKTQTKLKLSKWRNAIGCPPRYTEEEEKLIRRKYREERGWHQGARLASPKRESSRLKRAA